MATHILIECPDLIASVRVGVLAALRPLEDAGEVEVRFRKTFAIRKEDIAWCDLLICVRGSERASEKIIEAARSAGRLVLYFLDDDLLHVPGDVPGATYFTQDFVLRSLSRCLRASDILWCVNPLLEADYSGYPRLRSLTCPAPVPLPDAPPPHPEHGVTRFLYAGSVDHAPLVEAYLAPAARRMCEAYGEAVSFTFIGPSPGLRLPQVRHLPFLEDYAAYEREVFSGGFDAGLAVVGDLPFYQRKYYNKYIEYTRIGAVGLYTDGPLYRMAVRDGENGWLCQNDPEAWFRAMEAVHRTPQASRRAVHANAWTDLSVHYAPAEIHRRLLSLLPELAAFQAPPVAASNIRLSSLRLSYYLTRIQEQWSGNKLLFLPMLFYRFFRKLLRRLHRITGGNED